MKDLKHLLYFENLLQEAHNDLIAQAQNEGKICVAYACENTPEPLLNLPGAFSTRLRAPRTGSMEMATYYMTSFLCEYSRALLERAIEGGYNFADCMITPDGCSMMNRAVENMELLKTMGKDKPKFFFEYMEIPMKADDNSLNLYAYKQELLASYKPVPGKRGSIGIPLCLGFYELLPFWWAFWTKLGFAVHTSPVSSRGLYLAGQATIPSDTACFPAKLSHGHIKALSQMELDAIFYPCLTYNVDEGLGDNHYNCPVVAYYPEVLAGNCPELEGKKFIYDYVGIHRPKDFVHKMAKNVLPKYFGGISEKEVQEAADAAYAEYEAHMAKIRVKGSEIIDEARRQGKRIIVLAGRPYHVDPEVNHGIDRLITRHGAAVVTEDSISNRVQKFPTSVLNQWTYHSRLYAAAKYCTTQKDMDLVQLVSFGCGVDAITTDETREILQAGGKLYTQLKIDEITNLGAVNIRLRSLFAALDERDEVAEEKAAAKAEA